MRKRVFGALMLLAFAPISVLAEQSFKVAAPAGELVMEVTVGEDVKYSVVHEGDVIVASSPISMSLVGGAKFGVEPKLLKSSTTSVKGVIETPFYKHSQIEEEYNELTLKFKGDYNIVVRAYDDGVAYRFVSTSKKPFVVESEQATFNFAEDHNVYIPYVLPGKTTRDREYNDIYEAQYTNTFENYYTYTSLTEWDNQKLAFTPILAEVSGGRKVLIAESDILDYPGMFLCNDNNSTTLTGKFATYPKEIIQGGHNMLQGLVTEREPFLAKYERGTTFPWRIVQVAKSDVELADNNIVYKLATPSKIADTSWIKPGKVMWDWWCDNNVYGVDFRAGVNNETYRYFIDFAAENNVQYVILDEGWAVNLEADLLQLIPEIDMQGLADYAAQRGVDLILWGGYLAFERDMERVCKHYSEMGIKGFKIDFMDRDDQPMVEFFIRAAETAAKYNLMMDFHGAYKPTGLNRTYPNVVNYEAVKGLEQLKWSNTSDQVTYETILPFIRMAAGPMDYTQGAMKNATKANFYPSFTEPMSQGTRARQLALYSILESPLNMLCDSPSNYMNELECFEYIAHIPTVWDETRIVDGKIGEYVTIARRAGDVWYVGSITNWDPRTAEIDLSFLGAGEYSVEIFRDGINADRAARDYKKEIYNLPASRTLSVDLVSGGGCALKIMKRIK